MSEREIGLGPKQEVQSALDRLEARRLQLVETGEIVVEPDIAGSEAFELLDNLLQQGLALTREVLSGRTLRLTKEEINQLVEENDAIEILPSGWRNYFIESGYTTIAIEGLREPATLIFPGDLGTQADLELAHEAEAFWANSSGNSHPLFEDITDPIKQRELLLQYLAQ